MEEREQPVVEKEQSVVEKEQENKIKSAPTTTPSYSSRPNLCFHILSQSNYLYIPKVKKAKSDAHTKEKKRKRNRKQNAEVETHATVESVEGKNKDKSLARKPKPKPKEEVDLDEKSDGVVDHCHSNAEEIQDFHGHRDSDTGAVIKPCRSKKDKKKRKKEFQNSLEKGEGNNKQEEVYTISSGDDDCSKGMKKWIMEYHHNRPGLDALQHQIDEFITAHEEKLEESIIGYIPKETNRKTFGFDELKKAFHAKRSLAVEKKRERKEKEALAAEGGGRLLYTIKVERKLPILKLELLWVRLLKQLKFK
ncbi:unnamed protein product [Sphenostylis stenocarpa]|uniref:Uncharacterized protein n=1 Tax=Sphenostylis stenocarpa TaxID=92480 RepID=A0AA86VXD8_9FABA|nr:unnamed protein product [Sphenostylis stenocarpa]